MSPIMGSLDKSPPEEGLHVGCMDGKQDIMHLKDPHRFNVVKMLVVKYFCTGTPRSYQHID
jgi:hypothetical protein